jgi:predicted enzyme involved in methoxymalonyl-ACP biosynthesis
MELAMLDALVERVRSKGITTLVGHYLPTKKNAMVADHYANLGFSRGTIEAQSESSRWLLDTADYQSKNRYIQVQGTP